MKPQRKEVMLWTHDLQFRQATLRYRSPRILSVDTFGPRMKHTARAIARQTFRNSFSLPTDQVDMSGLHKR